MNLIVNHMFQPLIVRRADEYLGVQLTTGKAIEQDLPMRQEQTVYVCFNEIARQQGWSLCR